MSCEEKEGCHEHKCCSGKNSKMFGFIIFAVIAGIMALLHGKCCHGKCGHGKCCSDAKCCHDDKCEDDNCDVKG